MPKTALRALSARAIVSAIADAADRWSDADFPPRVRATQTIEARTGQTTPVVEYALDRLFFSLTREALETAIAGELGSLAALDGFVERRGRPDGFARGVERAIVVSDAGAIGDALPPALFALCAKCSVLVKDRDATLVAAFIESLIEERPEFAESVIAQPWRGPDDPRETALLGSADVVVAFAGAPALTAIRAHLRPDALFVPFGHGLGVGYLDAAAFARAGEHARRELAAGIARDALIRDGDGDGALHALFVAQLEAETGVSEALAAAFARAAVEFPAAVPAPAPPIAPVGGLHDVATYLERQRQPLAVLAVADPADPAIRALAETIGAVRVARFGTLHAPPLAGDRGGRPRISDFIRWIDAE
jgi:hypothetical protein